MHIPLWLYFCFKRFNFLELVLGDYSHISIASFLPHRYLFSHKSSLSKSVNCLVHVLCIDQAWSSENIPVLCWSKIRCKSALIAEFLIFDLIRISVLLLKSRLGQRIEFKSTVFAQTFCWHWIRLLYLEKLIVEVFVFIFKWFLLGWLVIVQRFWLKATLIHLIHMMLFLLHCQLPLQRSLMIH